MFFNKKNKDVSPQDWRPHWVLRLLQKIWMVVFTLFKIAVGAAATVAMIVLICCFVFVGILADYLQDDILPDAEVESIMEGYDHEQNSYLYYLDSNGEIQLYQNIYAETSSKWAAYDDIPEDLIHAAVAIEDHRFYEHQGVDWVTTVKATARMFFGDSSAGGSSITQQLIKNILLSEDESADDVTVQRKVLEIFRAIQLEKHYDKDAILEMYLNVIYLGQNCRGVRSAASAYFGKELEKLTLAECASLISITNNPSLFDPYIEEEYEYAGEVRNGMERNKYRRTLVLNEMLTYGWITQEEYDEAVDQELVLKSGIDAQDRLAQCDNDSCGYEDTVSTFILDGSTYYCPSCNQEVSIETDASRTYYSWYTDTVLEDVAQALAEQEGVSWNATTKELYLQKIQSGGYHIYTCLDMEVQEQLDAIYTDLDEIPSVRGGQQLQSAMVIIDNRTGDIVALVGGVGEKVGFDNWNRATDAQLQSGSSIKPLAVYAPGFESGAITPATVIKDLPNNYTNGAYPLNDSRTYSYSRTIYSGVTSSVNAVAANTLELIGLGYSYDFAKEKFGLSTLIESYVDSSGYEHTDIAMGPLALGAQTWGVRVRDMATAFATFANDGVYRKARTFTKVYDSDGNLVLDNVQEQEQILSQKSVDYMNYCLVNATHNGTGTEADLDAWNSVGITTAGKTGTTGDNKDKWYCGFTGYYTAAVWCGFDTPAQIRTLYVNNPSAYLFQEVMEPIHEGLEDMELYNDDNMTWTSMCLDTGKLATSACSADIRSLDRVGSALIYPEDRAGSYCSRHVLVDYCSGGGVATEYCKKFAEVDDSVKISEKALLKLTQSEIDEMLRAAGYGLNSEFLTDDYVYLINGSGGDAVFNGIYGKLNQSVDAPYKVCTEHTQKAWEKYEKQKAEEEAAQKAEEEAAKATDPTASTAHTKPQG